MCERNSLNPGYVGSLLNFAPPESLYFTNLRGNGAHLPGLHQLQYNRRDVCTLPWTPSSSGPAAAPAQHSRAFEGYCPPFLSSALSAGSSKTHVDECAARCFRDLKTEEAGVHEELYTTEHGVRAYSDLDSGHRTPGQPDPDSASPHDVNGTKQEQEPPSSHACSRSTFGAGSGNPFCSSTLESTEWVWSGILTQNSLINVYDHSSYHKRKHIYCVSTLCFILLSCVLVFLFQNKFTHKCLALFAAFLPDLLYLFDFLKLFKMEN